MYHLQNVANRKYSSFSRNLCNT